MMMNFFSFFKKKWFWIILVIIALLTGGVLYQRNKNAQPRYNTEVIKRQTLVQTVSATGTVKAAEEVRLNFKSPGRLTELRVKVGDQVKAGQLLAILDSRDTQSALLSAEAGLKSAQATLDKIRAGAKNEDIAVYEAAVKTAETNLANIKTTQAQAVANAWAQLVGLPAIAVANPGNLSTATITVTGTYKGQTSGSYIIRIDDTNSPTYSYFGLESGINQTGSRLTPVPLGNLGLNIQFSATGTLYVNDSWTINIPNTSSASYASLLAAYQAAQVAEQQQVQSAERVLAEAKLRLEQAKAPAQTYDVKVAEAAVESARAALLRAQNDLADRLLIAPVSGIVTRVNNKVGETISLTQPVVVILAAGDKEIKVQVPESDIAKLAVGQTADITLDAFGSAEHFSGHVSFIDPASTVIAEVVYYEVTVLFDDNDEKIKPGMTANVEITAAVLENVLVAPLRAVKYDENRQAFVEILQGAEVIRRPVKIGLRGDQGLVEVLDGLSIGEQVITFRQNGK